MDLGIHSSRYAIIWLLTVLVGGSVSLDNVRTNNGVCNSTSFELYTGTRLQTNSKIDLIYTWCGHSWCYKTALRTGTGSSVETFSEWRRRQTCCSGYKETVPGAKPVKCEPICQEPCLNGNCTDIDTCTCHPGYEKETPYNCTPICANGCSNAKCTAPDTCTCHPGYSRSELEHICMPVCEHNCTNGFCISPNRCECHVNFELDKVIRHVCVPKCKKACVNGLCTAPDICTCDPNYRLDEEDKFKCNPVCNKSCEHGFCAGPDLCKCDEGYRHPSGDITDECAPYCSSPCDNGFGCTRPNLCTRTEPLYYRDYEVFTSPVKTSTVTDYKTETDSKETVTKQDVSVNVLGDTLALNEKSIVCSEVGEQYKAIRCHNITTLKLVHNCECNIRMNCTVPRDFINPIHERNCSNGNSDFRMRIVPIEGGEAWFCEWCYCPHLFNVNIIALEVCEYTVVDHLILGYSKWLVFLIIGVGCTLILISLAVLLVWLRRKRVDYIIRYKDDSIYKMNDHEAYEGTREIVSDDD